MQSVKVIAVKCRIRPGLYCLQHEPSWVFLAPRFSDGEARSPNSMSVMICFESHSTLKVPVSAPLRWRPFPRLNECIFCSSPVLVLFCMHASVHSSKTCPFLVGLFPFLVPDYLVAGDFPKVDFFITAPPPLLVTADRSADPPLSPRTFPVGTLINRPC